MFIHDRRFKANDCKDDCACVDRCKPIGHANHQSVFAYIVVHGIVAGEGNEATECKAEREEDLSSSIQPALEVQKLLHLEAKLGGQRVCRARKISSNN